MTPSVEAGINKAIEQLDLALAELPNEDTPLVDILDDLESACNLIRDARDRLFELLPPEHE
jgi:hypothetical protein